MTASLGDVDVGAILIGGFLFVVAAVVVLALGVWFGMVAIAPRIIRRQDHAEEEDELRDRHD